MPPAAPTPDRPRERLLSDGARSLSDADLLALVLGTGGPGRSARVTALTLLEAVPLTELAWAPPDALAGWPGLGVARAAAIAAAFELGRRAGWSPPRRGERCLDPGRVHELLRHAAHAEREGFHVVLLDVRGRLLRTVHSVVFAHNHPSGVMRSLHLC